MEIDSEKTCEALAKSGVFDPRALELIKKSSVVTLMQQDKVKSQDLIEAGRQLASHFSRLKTGARVPEVGGVDTKALAAYGAGIALAGAVTGQPEFVLAGAIAAAVAKFLEM
jgi:hypothetical protein